MSELALYAADMAALKAIEEDITGITRVELYFKETIARAALPAVFHDYPLFAEERMTAGTADSRHKLTYTVPTTIIVGACTKDSSLIMELAVALMDRYIGTIIDNGTLGGACTDVHIKSGGIAPVPWNDGIEYICVKADLEIMHMVKAE